MCGQGGKHMLLARLNWDGIYFRRQLQASLHVRRGQGHYVRHVPFRPTTTPGGNDPAQLRRPVRRSATVVQQGTKQIQFRCFDARVQRGRSERPEQNRVQFVTRRGCNSKSGKTWQSTQPFRDLDADLLADELASILAP